jgi:hypothetical protein
MDKKVCSKCGDEKPIEEFHYVKSSKKYRNSCKICFNESRRNPNLRLVYERKLELRLKKKEEFQKLMEYYKTDEWKEIKKENKKKRRENNKEKERVRQYNKWKRRWNEDELFAIKVRLRNLIRNSFRRGGYKKFNTSTEDIVGVNYNEFKNYLESKFIDGMNWDNRGEWHIDHIIPLSSAKSEEELRKLCHYTNLQPLWEKDNLKKSNNIL